MEKRLELTIDPIFNPHGPNKIVTRELIDAISTVFSHENTSCMAKENAEELIERLKKGYEVQSGEKYE